MVDGTRGNHTDAMIDARIFRRAIGFLIKQPLPSTTCSVPSRETCGGSDNRRAVEDMLVAMRRAGLAKA